MKNLLYEIREHCFRLSSVLGHPGISQAQHRDAKAIDGTQLDWGVSSEWLYMAASVEEVRVDTSKFDSSILMCRPAWEFQSKRSELLSILATQLTIFNFVWGSLETTIKIINPPRVPKYIKCASSLVDHATFYLKNEYEPQPLLRFYEEALINLREDIESLPYYGKLAKEFKFRPSFGLSGLGLHIVRLIRNKFAHGTLTMPIPEEWDQIKDRDHHLVEFCTRLVLLTIQMLVLAYFKNRQFDIDAIDVDEDGDGEDELQNAHDVLRTLHYSVERDCKYYELFTYSRCRD